jgi:hypothetical protein
MGRSWGISDLKHENDVRDNHAGGKKKRTGREIRPMREGGKFLMIGEPVLLGRRPMLSFVENQSR